MLCYYTYAVFDRHLFTVMNFYTSEEGQINMSTKTQTTPFFYKQKQGFGLNGNTLPILNLLLAKT